MVRESVTRPPDLLTAAVICLDDGCPPEEAMQMCRMCEDYGGESCRECWYTYLLWVANGRRNDPYARDRLCAGA